MMIEIYTGADRNYYVWSVVGILSLTASLSLETGTNSSLGGVAGLIGTGNCAIGIIGVLLTCASCIKMCYRLGIMPGLYHSTICVPSWNDNKFTFQVSSGFYSSFACGILSFLMYATEIVAVNSLSIDKVISLHIQSYICPLLIFYSYFYGIARNHELLGNLLVCVVIHIYVALEGDSFGLWTVLSGLMLLVFSGGMIYFVKKAVKTLDTNSVMIIIALVQGGLGAIFLGSSWLSGVINLSITLYGLGKGILFVLGIYAIGYSKPIEIAFLFVFPTVSGIVSAWDINLISIAALSGILLGFLIILGGDVPFKYCCKYRNSSPKSPLHSPLL